MSSNGTPFPPSLDPILPALIFPQAKPHLSPLSILNATTHHDPELIRHFQSRTSNTQTTPQVPTSESPTASPVRHPDCCLSLSARLLSTLTQLLPPSPSLVLSIGSGTGLLERAMQLSTLTFQHFNQNPKAPPDPESSDPETPPLESVPHFVSGISIRGVEVVKSANKHLPSEHVIVVRGTWDLPEKEIVEAAALLWVYPRMKSLVERGLDVFGRGRAWRGEMHGVLEEERGRRGVGTVVWLGPVVDWEEGGFGEVVRGWAERAGGGVEEMRGKEMGLLEEEMGVVVRMRRQFVAS